MKFDIHITPRTDTKGKSSRVRGFEDLGDALAALLAIGARRHDYHIVSLYLSPVAGERLGDYLYSYYPGETSGLATVATAQKLAAVLAARKNTKISLAWLKKNREIYPVELIWENPDAQAMFKRHQFADLEKFLAEAVLTKTA